MKKYSGNCLTVLTCLLIFLFNGGALAISSNDANSIYTDTTLYDPNSTGCSVGGGNTVNIGLPAGSNVYVLGDSITAIAEDAYVSSFQSKSITANVDGSGNRGLLTVLGVKEGRLTTGMQAIAADTEQIKTANAIVVALGTNEGLTIEGVDGAIAALRAINTTAPIYWVNIISVISPRRLSVDRTKSVNTTLNTESTAKGFKVIDWYKTVMPSGDPLNPTGSETDDANLIDHDSADIGVHPTTAGITALTDLVVGAVATGGSGSANTVAASYDPTSLTFPTFPDQSQIAASISDYIQTNKPSSPWLTMSGIGPNIGAWLMDESKSRNINPLFIVASGNMENGFGTSGEAPKLNNFFGMKKNKTEYRSFATPQEGIRAFMDDVQRNTQTSSGRYSAAKNIYEYFSIHQAGSIVYPGEPFDPKDIDSKPGVTQDSYDESMNVWLSWDKERNKDNPRPDHQGQYTPLIYFRTNIAVINAITGLSLSSENPQRSGVAPTFDANGCPSTLQAGVNGWDLPGEGQHPMIYYSQQRKSNAPVDAAVTGYYGDSPYGKGTIAGCGCGPTSFAMVVNTITGVTTTPDVVAAWADSNGYRYGDGDCPGSAWWWTNKSSETKWGVKARQIQITEAPDLLKQGNLIMVSVGDGSVLLSAGGNGHLLVMRAVTDDGKFLFADPSDSNGKRKSGGDSASPTTIFQALGSSRTPLDAATVSTGLKALWVMEKV